jgi:hypothetical protein
VRCDVAYFSHELILRLTRAELEKYLQAQMQVHNAEIKGLHDSVTQTEINLAETCKRKVHVESRLFTLGEIVSQLLTLNAALVSKVTGSTMSRTSLTDVYTPNNHFRPSLPFRHSTGQTQSVVNWCSSLCKAGTMGMSGAPETTLEDVADVIRKLQCLNLKTSHSDHLIQLHAMYQEITTKLLEFEDKSFESCLNDGGALDDGVPEAAPKFGKERITRNYADQNKPFSTKHRPTIQRGTREERTAPQTKRLVVSTEAGVSLSPPSSSDRENKQTNSMASNSSHVTKLVEAQLAGLNARYFELLESSRNTGSGPNPESATVINNRELELIDIIQTIKKLKTDAGK